METIEKKMIRMELQIGQLIRIVANMNERVNELEDAEKKKKRMFVEKRMVAERA